MAISGIITRRFRAHNAEQLFESLSESSLSRYFFFIGKVNSWNNDAAPPAPTDTFQNVSFDIHRGMMALKRITASDVTYVVPRYNWTANTTYKKYSDTDPNLFPTSTDLTSNTTFYVMTDTNNVYKCIDNNRGGRSTYQPTGTSSNIISTPDGYRWKFLYGISSAETAKFVTPSYIPVRRLTANNGTAQWVVQQAASNGSIDHIEITNTGTDYISTANTFAGITNTSVVILNTNALQTDSVYVGSSIFLNGGLGSGQLRRVIRYNGTTRALTVNTAFTTTPNTSTSYIVSPSVIIQGDSGETSSSRATAYVANTFGGAIRKIVMISTGRNYSTANAMISANVSYGRDAELTPIISPPGGHGSNPILELGARALMLSVRTYGSEGNTFPTNNDFRMVGLIADPILRNGQAANASVIDQCTRLSVTTLSGSLTPDEVVVGAISKAKGRFVAFSNTNSAGTSGMVRLIHVATNGTGGIFRSGEQISGQTSGVTGTISTVTRPALKDYTGSILYTENRSPIERAGDQAEDIKLVVRF